MPATVVRLVHSSQKSRLIEFWRLRSRLRNGVIIRDPEILGRTPVFRGTRVPFQALPDYLEAGQTLDEFLEDFPTVTREAAVRALEQAKTLLLSELG